jgi:hypothetical protein
MRQRLATLACSLGLCAAVQAWGEIHQAPEAFVAEIFGARLPPKVLWLTKEMQAAAGAILGHRPVNLRQRYWSNGSKSVWVLEEIGKEELITAGFVVVEGRIEHVRVLAYRESRGEEVRYPSFRRQFDGAALDRDNRLDRRIDGIAGATLSVAAMERMARLALYFDRKSRE